MPIFKLFCKNLPGPSIFYLHSIKICGTKFSSIEMSPNIQSSSKLARGEELSKGCRQWYWNLWCSADETMNTRPFWFDWNWEVWYFEERKKLHLLVALNPDAIRSARWKLYMNTMDRCAPLPYQATNLCLTLTGTAKWWGDNLLLAIFGCC